MARKTSVKGLVLSGAAFLLMCVLKLWFTMFVLFSIALLLTLVSGKGIYCLSYCPVGTIQNVLFEKRKFFRPALLFGRWSRYVTIPLFWGLVAVILITSHRSVPILWVYFLQLMMAMIILAIITQSLFGKRYFCKNMCPLRIPVLAPVIKARKHIVNYFSGPRGGHPSPSGNIPPTDYTHLGFPGNSTE